MTVTGEFTIGRRSSFNFTIFALIAIGISAFIISKGIETIAHINALENSTVFVVRRELVGNKIDISTGSASSIADWKTYRNEKYGFEFKYPKDAIVTTQSYENGFKIEIKQGQFTLYIMGDLSHGKSLDEIIADYLSPALQATGQGAISELSIGGERAVEVAEFGGNHNEVYSLRLVQGGYAYIIWGYAIATWDREKGNYKQQNESFNKILATFKFIK